MYGDGRNKTHTLRRGGLRFDFSAVAKDPCEVQDDFGYKASLQCDTFARRYRDILGDGLADRILSAPDIGKKLSVIASGLKGTGRKLYVIIDAYDNFTNAVANTTAHITSAVVGDMTFQSGTEEAPSVVNVNLAGRTDLNAIRKSESPYVVTWNAAPVNVDFVLDAQSYADGYRISPDEKGLLLKRYMGMMILVR